MYYLETSCAIQVKAQAGGELIPLQKSLVDNAYAQMMTASRGRSRTRGGLVWPGLLRRLERKDTSYRN